MTRYKATKPIWKEDLEKKHKCSFKLYACILLVLWASLASISLYLMQGCSTIQINEPTKEQFPKLQLLDNLPRDIQDPTTLYEIIDFYEFQIKSYQEYVTRHGR